MVALTSASRVCLPKGLSDVSEDDRVTACWMCLPCTIGFLASLGVSPFSQLLESDNFWRSLVSLDIECLLTFGTLPG